MNNVPFAAQLEELAAYMASKISVPTIGIGGGYAPIGTIISYMGTTAPQDYLACDGSTKNIADYPQLAEFFAAQFGSANYFGGDGVTTFAVPDLRGEFLRGTGTNGHTGEGNGAAVGTHQSGTQFPYYQADPLSTGAILFPNNENANYPMNIDKDIAWTPQFMKFEGGVAGSYSLVRNFTARPTNTSVMYCIKAVCAGEVYSTEEREVGTWIDGKPLYEKTISDTVPSADTAGTSVNGYYSMGSVSIEHFVLIEGFFTNGIQDIPLNHAVSASGTTVAMQALGHDSSNTTNPNNLRIMNSNPTWNGRTFYATVRYTKTTT